MKKHLTSEILVSKADNQFDLVLEIIQRATHSIKTRNENEYDLDHKNVALQAIEDAEEGIDQPTDKEATLLAEESSLTVEEVKEPSTEEELTASNH